MYIKYWDKYFKEIESIEIKDIELIKQAKEVVSKNYFTGTGNIPYCPSRNTVPNYPFHVKQYSMLNRN